MHFTTAIIALALVACTGAHHAASVDGAIANPDAPASCDPSTGCIVTSLGPVQGTVSGTVLEVKGVPYAAPPVGNLRWRPPQPATPWTDILEATSFGSECMQLDLHDGTAAGGSEDCLTLNVWAPLQTTTPLPVMVFIHGGYYVQGGADIAWHGQYAYDGKSLASAGAIVVTRWMSSVLFGVKPTDPLTFVVVALVLGIVAFLASYVPARRAMRVDPIVALRYE